MTIQVRSNEKPQTPPPAAEAPKEKATPQGEAAVGDGKSKEQPQSSLSALESEKNSEQKESSESEPEGKQAETQEGQTKEEEKEDDEREPGQKKKGGFQRRIDKLSSQKAQALQEMEYWKQQALKNASGSKTDGSQTTTPIGNPSSLEAKPNPEKFDTHADYVEALADWKTEQKLKERDQKAIKERLDQEQSKIVSSYTERMKAFAKKTPDFEEVLGEVDHIPLSPALRDIVLTSDNGPELAYELAKSPGEYERIAKLPPLACAREMGKLEARFESSRSAERREKKLTQAPKPIEPVGTGGKGSQPKSIFDSSLTQSEYEALRNEQIKKRRQAG